LSEITTPSRISRAYAAAADQATAHDGPATLPTRGTRKTSPDLRGAELDFLELGLEHALERRLDLFDRLVDDRVVADVDALAPGQLAGPFGRSGR